MLPNEVSRRVAVVESAVNLLLRRGQTRATPLDQIRLPEPMLPAETGRDEVCLRTIDQAPIAAIVPMHQDEVDRGPRPLAHPAVLSREPAVPTRDDLAANVPMPLDLMSLVLMRLVLIVGGPELPAPAKGLTSRDSGSVEIVRRIQARHPIELRVRRLQAGAKHPVQRNHHVVQDEAAAGLIRLTVGRPVVPMPTHLGIVRLLARRAGQRAVAVLT